MVLILMFNNGLSAAYIVLVSWYAFYQAILRHQYFRAERLLKVWCELQAEFRNVSKLGLVF